MATVSTQPRSKRANQASTVNPYQTPAPVEQSRKATKEIAAPALHSDRTIGVTTFLGGVIAGAILIARNNVLVGRTGGGILFLLVAIVWQAVLIGVALALPFDMPTGVGFLVGMAHAVALQQLAKHWFAKPYALLAAGRGQWGHWGLAAAAIAVTLGCTVSIIAFLVTYFG